MKTIKQLLAVATVLVLMAINEKAHAADPWTPLATINNVIFSYQEATCSGHNVLLLKIENPTAKAVRVSFKLFSEDMKDDQVQANETKTGDCSQQNLVIEIPEGQTAADIVQKIYAQ